MTGCTLSGSARDTAGEDKFSLEEPEALAWPFRKSEIKDMANDLTVTHAISPLDVGVIARYYWIQCCSGLTIAPSCDRERRDKERHGTSGVLTLTPVTKGESSSVVVWLGLHCYCTTPLVRPCILRMQ